MIKEIKKTDFNEELTFLFETMCKELKEYKLTLPELVNIFSLLCYIIYVSACGNYGWKSLKDLLYGKYDFSSSPNILIEELKRTSKCGVEKYNLLYFLYYLGDKNHLNNITYSYLSSYNYPKWVLADIEGFKESYLRGNYFKRLFNDHITERINNTSYSKGWSLRLCSGREIRLKDASFVWQSCEGAFRFVTQHGSWGFVNDYTFEVIDLPPNIIQMYDFRCYRSRVLICDNNKFSIPSNNAITEDFNPARLRWGYIDMRGKIISKKEYTNATDFDNFVATVSSSSLGWDFGGPNYGVKSPYSHYQIDVFENLTDKSKQEREDIYNEFEKRKNMAEFYKQQNEGGMDDDEIIGALSNGHGDIFGY